MTIDEAIRHAEKVAEAQISRADALDDIPMFGSSEEDKKLIDSCYQCAEEHRQLAKWLKDYKRLKEKETPKMVNYLAEGYADGKLVYDMAECPNCGFDDFEEETTNWGYEHCPHCGQTLKWEVEE